MAKFGNVFSCRIYTSELGYKSFPFLRQFRPQVRAMACEFGTFYITLNKA